MNYLMLNVSKTKELVIAFRQKPASLSDLVMKGKKVERVSQYKYLGTVLESKLNFDQNAVLIQKKCQSRIYLLQKLRNLNVNSCVALVQGVSSAHVVMGLGGGGGVNNNNDFISIALFHVKHAQLR